MPLLLLVIAVLAAPHVQAQNGASVSRAVESITAADIHRHIAVLAHDSMGGRNTPSRGLEQAATYVASEFRRIGLAPGGDEGSFIQRYPLQKIRLDAAGSSIVVDGGPIWRFDRDVVRAFGAGAIEQTGPVVLLTGTPTSGDPLVGVGLEGAIVVAALPGSALRTVVQSALAKRPAVVILPGSVPDAVWERALRQQVETSVSTAWATVASPMLLQVREGSLYPVLQQHGVDVQAALSQPFEARPLPSLQVTVTLRNEVAESMSAPNVVGILSGSDPALNDEYLVYSAHMDHVGYDGDGVGGCRAAANDKICNGADDDASGTSAVIEMAEAFATLNPRPKRSIIFLTVSGEEKGLWGSDYFATHPPVSISQIVANLNSDMVGRNWKDTIVVIGREHSDLGATLDGVNRGHPELGMTAIDDLWPEQNFYFRSDHYNFARQGVPILFFFNGTHDQYHRPSDEVVLIDAEKESRIVKLIFYLGLEIANRAERPQWRKESYDRIVGTSP